MKSYWCVYEYLLRRGQVASVGGQMVPHSGLLVHGTLTRRDVTAADHGAMALQSIFIVMGLPILFCIFSSFFCLNCVFPSFISFLFNWLRNIFVNIQLLTSLFIFSQCENRSGEICIHISGNYPLTAPALTWHGPASRATTWRYLATPGPALHYLTRPSPKRPHSPMGSAAPRTRCYRLVQSSCRLVANS